MKCPAVCLVALALLGSYCDAQGGGYRIPKFQRPQDPKTQVPQEPPQQKLSFEKPLTWTYPQDPTPSPKVEVPFVPAPPVPAATIAVECRENEAHVEVKKDMFGIGQFINPNDLTLGNCGPVAEDNAAQVLIYESALQDCQSTSMMTEDSLIYTFTLNYNPQPVGGSPVVRTSRAAVIVECHYPRKHNVSSLPIRPLWVPFSAVKVAEEFLYFTMSLMTDDWMYERPSYQYFLGDMINIEVIVQQYFHVPLRVYVDYCVATLSPDANSNPSYAFIDNNGCLVDARITGSSSRFMARTAENKLCFQLEAFRFQGADSGLLYFTCNLKATVATNPIDSTHRACSYVSGWREASGVDAACSSCETGAFAGISTSGVVTTNRGTSGVGTTNLGTSGVGTTNRGTGGGAANPSVSRKMRDVSKQAPFFEWEGHVTLGPIPIADKPLA